MPTRCTWDAGKAKFNHEKHGISFEEAEEVFDDPNKIETHQRVDGEDRWKMIGWSTKRLLVVVYTERGKIRIISARKAERDEKARYVRR